MNYPEFWKSASTRRKRIYFTAFVFILAVLATVIGYLVPPSAQESELIYRQLNQTLSQGEANNTLVQNIFFNNFPLCLLMFVPLVGFGVGMFILFSTGQAFRGIFDIQAANLGNSTLPSSSPTPLPNIEPATAFGILLLVGVVFLLEYVSYSIAMGESVWLFRRILQNRLKGEWKPLLMLIGIVALLLIIGAIVETVAVTTPLPQIP